MSNDDIVPRGLHCYKRVQEGKIKICPYWSIDTTHETQNNGHCSYLNLGDWENPGIGLLWDKVKECNINVEFDED